MKGIILAGGAGSRLYPMTKVITKQLQPIYDKPMIYYPLSLLMLCGIKEIAIITSPHDKEHFVNLLGDGSKLGVKIEFIIQEKPEGLAQAYTLTKNFLEGGPSMMVLGDNLFHGNFDVFRAAIKKQMDSSSPIKAQVFAYPVTDPERYGVVEFDQATGKVITIEEKPTNPKSNFAIPGLYLFDGSVSERVENQKPSKRGELEITDLIQTYLDEETLGFQVINRGMAWLDTGTPLSLLEASSYIAAIEQRQGLKVACLEEVAFRRGYISLDELKALTLSLPNSTYCEYLELIISEVPADLSK